MQIKHLSGTLNYIKCDQTPSIRKNFLLLVDTVVQRSFGIKPDIQIRLERLTELRK